MILVAGLLLIIGVLLSAFFSGSETGFYRASRVRLVIRNLEGDTISRYLLMLVNNPGLFVATTLIGNNVANYLTSLSIVLITTMLWHSNLAEMLAPILIAPMLFVYGELMPKNLFFQAPNLLFRLSAPLFLFFTVLFMPASVLLWAMSKLLEKSLGQAPERVRLTLARREVHDVIEEGIEAGIISKTQRTLSQNFSLVASKPVGEFCTPINKAYVLPATAGAAQVKKLAAKRELPDVAIYRGGKLNVIGYVRVVELLLAEEGNLRVIPMPSISEKELFGEVLLQMQTKHQTIVRVVGEFEKTVGILSIDQLTDPLLKGALVSLRR
jgi:CBS domain containing-hemolysin-like protein